MKTIRIVAAAVPIVATAIALQVIQAQQAGATRTELQRHDLTVPGREVIQVRVDLEPGSAFPSHTHPGDVLEGTWQYEIAGKPVTAKAGDVLFVPARTDTYSIRGVARPARTVMKVATRSPFEAHPWEESTGWAVDRCWRSCASMASSRAVSVTFLKTPRTT